MKLIETGDLILRVGKDAKKEISKAMKVEDSFMELGGKQTNWRSVTVVNIDGSVEKILNPEDIFSTSVEELEELVRQAKELAKKQFTSKPDGRHPDSFAI